MKEKQLSLLDMQLPRLPQPPAEPLDVTVVHDDKMNLVMLAKKTTLLKGLYAIIRMPTEERLTLLLENLTKENFDKLVPITVKHMNDVDEKWKVKSFRGRSGRATFKKVTGTTYTLGFSPFPSSILNVFKKLRNMRVAAYHTHCIVLQRQEEHAFQNNINILPYANIPDFVTDLKSMNATIDDVNKQIIEFLQSSEWDALMLQLLPYYQYQVPRQWTVEHATLFSTEIALETKTVLEHIEEEFQKMYADGKEMIDKETTEALRIVHEEFERGQRSIAEQALDYLKREIDANVAIVISGMKKDPQHIKKQLARLRKKTSSIGLEMLAKTVIDPLSQLIDNPDKVEELFGTVHLSDLPSKVDGRIRSLIETL